MTSKGIRYEPHRQPVNPYVSYIHVGDNKKHQLIIGSFSTLNRAKFAREVIENFLTKLNSKGYLTYDHNPKETKKMLTLYSANRRNKHHPVTVTFKQKPKKYASVGDKCEISLSGFVKRSNNKPIVITDKIALTLTRNSGHSNVFFSKSNKCWGWCYIDSNGKFEQICIYRTRNSAKSAYLARVKYSNSQSC